MAEESLVPEEGVEEPVVASEEEAAQTPVTIEDFARERGWRPKEEFSGPETEWRDARSFIAFGMDRNRDLVRDLKSVREDTARIVRTQAQITEQAVENARREERQRWEGVHREAVEQGDVQAATQAVEKIAELSVLPVRTVDPAVDNFRRENAWFDNDAAARAIAVAVAGTVAERGGSVEEQLREAKEAVHKRFPEYAPQQAKPAPSVANPGPRVVDPARNRKKGFNDLPRDAQDACRALVAKGYTTQDGYVAQYFGGAA